MKFMLRRIAIEDASTGQFFHRPMWIFVTAFPFEDGGDGYIFRP
jgi:hypothetical protein